MCFLILENLKCFCFQNYKKLTFGNKFCVCKMVSGPKSFQEFEKCTLGPKVSAPLLNIHYFFLTSKQTLLNLLTFPKLYLEQLDQR